MPKSAETRVVQVYLYAADHAKLKAVAAREGMSSWVRELVLDELGRLSKPKTGAEYAARMTANLLPKMVSEPFSEAP